MDTQLLPYRLKSARRKKRLQKEDRDKHLLRLERKLKTLQENDKEVTMETLDHPYQKGWKRLFVLTKAVAESDKAGFYQAILDKINEVQYHYDESFKRRNKGNKWYRGDYPDLPKLRNINMYYRDANKLNLSDEQLACFKLVDYWNAPYYRWEPHYQFAEPSLFEIKVLPHMIYKVRVGDALLAQEESFLGDYLYSSKPPACRLAKIKGRRYNRWNSDYNEKSKFADPFKSRQVLDVLAEYE